MWVNRLVQKICGSEFQRRLFRALWVVSTVVIQIGRANQTNLRQPEAKNKAAWESRRVVRCQPPPRHSRQDDWQKISHLVFRKQAVLGCLLCHLCSTPMIISFYIATQFEFIHNINSTMTKRHPENNISHFEESGRKLLKDLNSDPVKVEKNEFP